MIGTAQISLLLGIPVVFKITSNLEVSNYVSSKPALMVVRNVSSKKVIVIHYSLTISSLSSSLKFSVDKL